MVQQGSAATTLKYGGICSQCSRKCCT